MKDQDKEICRCPDCGLLSVLLPLQEGSSAVCPRCSALLKSVAWSWSRVLALWLAGVLFWGASLQQPLLSLYLGGQEQTVAWWQIPHIMWEKDAFLFFIVTVLTTLVAPSVYFFLVACLLIMQALSVGKDWSAPIWQWLNWSKAGLMLEVFFLGVLISAVKLSDSAVVVPSWSLLAFVGLILVVSALSASLRADFPHQPSISVLPPASRRLPLSLTWALVISAWILYLPANLLPMMTVTSLGKNVSDTIIDGVIHFIDADQWGLAMVIFFASIVIPLSKLFILMGLLFSVQFKWCQSLVLKTKVYRWMKWIGVWSMIDVFVIIMLIALVQFGELALVQAGSGALAFLLVILLTLLATHLFQSQWLWIACQETKNDDR